MRLSTGSNVSAHGFHAARWLPGPHLQTVWGRAVRSRALVHYRREALPTPDGDTLLVDHLDGPPGAPRAVLLHGLEGSSFSVYLQGLALLFRNAGWSVSALNFRYCARELADRVTFIPNGRPRLYHSGETTDFDLVARTLAGREPGAPLFAVGVSLGGNVLLKWLGENPQQTIVRAAAALSVPFDLEAGGRFMETGLGPLYVATFVKTLTEKAVHIAARFPEAGARLDIPRMRRARTFFEFDDVGTAPLHGFAGARDYYEKSSSLSFLRRISIPVLCVGSEDDPFVPADTLRLVERAAPANLETLFVGKGGHAGFVGGASPFSPYYWAEETIVSWLRSRT